ncbi:hypothetical protein [Maribellus luteus]|nr:hypothetical protein [Maribellus luteus]
MEDKIKQILEIVDELDESKKQTILLECASRIGTPEWAEAVKDLIRRMENLNK